MQILNLISPNDIKRLDGRVAEMSQIDQPGYLRHFDFTEESVLVGSCREDLSDIRETADLMDASTVVLRHFDPDLKGLKGLIYGLVHSGRVVIVVLGNPDFYKLTLDWPVDIAFPPMDRDQDGYKRFEYIYHLVQSHTIDNTRDHWFWELTNPAELTIYRSVFTSAIQQLFAGVFSYRCYVDSYYGIRYSQAVGLPTPPIGGDVPEGYRWPMQDVLYHMNKEQLESFAAGHSGAELVRVHQGVMNG